MIFLEDFSVISIKEVLSRLKSSENGLSSYEAEKRLQQNGKNELSGEKSHGFLFCFFKQMCDFSIIILLLAAGVSFFYILLEW